jgi:hypothetical protein
VEFNTALTRLSPSALAAIEQDVNFGANRDTGTSTAQTASEATFAIPPEPAPELETEQLIKKTMESLMTLESFQDSPEKETIIRQLNTLVEVKQVCLFMILSDI